MHFEIKGIDLDLSDRNENYYMVDIIVYEDTDDGIYESEMKVVYDSSQKVIHGFHRADLHKKITTNFLTYQSKNGIIIQLCNCTNSYRHSDSFNKFYQLHKANIDFKLFNILRELKNIN